MALLLRPATAADVPLVLSFIRELADFERLADEVEATAATLAAILFPPGGGPGGVHCLLAFVDDRPAGFALYFYNFSTFLARRGLYLEDLFVRPDFRGRGVGKALLLQLARQAHAEGCGRMEWSVLDWNESAVAFYESLGARRLTDWTTCRLTRDTLARLAAPTA